MLGYENTKDVDINSWIKIGQQAATEYLNEEFGIDIRDGKLYAKRQV